MIRNGMHRVFVYGTLKRGAERNDLMGTAVFAGKAVTAAPFRMLDGPYPVLCENGPRAYRVIGDVYEVDDATLAVLDDYEGVSERYYERIEIDVLMSDEKAAPKTCRVFVYIGCADYWNSQTRQLYATLDANGHLDWTSPQSRASGAAR